ncbi:hypothetical protein P4H61_10795 [Paenibacillus peoriae]|uniref:hypothetical protein n=1 Tax=Paenibacillus peoriae TaxID=59893 RepID=UPI00145C49DC|nr:hypothetical protein [Paenibacillus peoriae]MEC0181980.1 hypothetical protein [Paenibacillus peoriae]
MGWQTTGYDDVKAVHRYEVVQDVWNGYSRSFDGIPAGSGYHIRITGLTTPDGYGSRGAGNVYVN